MIRVEFQTGNAAFLPDDPENGWRGETARLLCELAERTRDGEKFPLKLRDSNGNGVGFADHPAGKTDDETVVTIIAGKLHEWIYFPGEWVPFEPKADQLMRMRR
ncbi:MAG: hypothetical protein ABI600_18140 [Luteolibacter sp.]|uniref:hypothetical protein n=1 Tax=Luteolibacter sp. TaxID=1962973 RepID=UPI0032656E66